MAYCQSPFASSSAHSFYRKLCATRELFCSSGLKDGVCFHDVDKRVFHSTYRATHHVMASITQILPLDRSGRVTSPPNTEKSSQLEESIVEPERSICFADGAQHKVHNCVQTLIGCIDSEMEQENFDGCDTPTILHPEAPSLLSSAPLQNGHANTPSNCVSSEGVGNPTALDLHISYLDIQEPYGLSELHKEHPEAPSTPDLQPEVKFWDFEGNGNRDVKDSFCSMENVCIDNDERESLVLEGSNYMSASAGSFSTERVDVKESFCTVVDAHINDNIDSGNLFLEEEDIISACINDSFYTLIDVGISEYSHQESPVLEENDIMPACIGGCLAESYVSLMRESRVVCTGFNSPYISSYTSFDCWTDAKTYHRSKLSPCRWHRIRKVPNQVEISSPSIWHTFTMKRLSFRSLPTSWFRLTLQELVKLLKQRSIDWEVAMQLMAYSNIYLRVCRSRHLSARGRRAVEKADARRDGDYKKVNVRIIFQDYQKCHSKGRRNRVSGNRLPPEHNSLGIEQADQYASIPPSKVVVDSALKLYCLEHPPRSIEPSSDGVSETLKGSLKQGESNQSGNNLFPETSIGSTSKVPNLVEGRDGAMTRRESSLQEMDEFVEDSRESSGFSSQSVTDVDDWTSVPADKVNECLLEVSDGGMACSRESLEQEMVEFKEDIKESCGFPSLMSVNEVDDWTSVPADQVDECLDTCLYSLQHHPTCFRHDLTPELKLLDPVLMRNPVKPASSATDGFNDEGSPIFHVHANANKTNDLQSSMPNGGVHEKQSKKKLENFAEGFLLGRHIRRQQRRAQQAPPYPPRDSAGYVSKNLGLKGKPLGEVKPNPYMTCSIKDNNDAMMSLTSSTTDNDRSVGADVVIDIVGLIAYLESQYNGSATYLSNYTDTPFLGGQVVNINIGAVIVTIIAIVVYTRTLLEGGLAWVGARTQKGEDN